MIKDVKSYFQTVATRLSNAFAVEDFDTEQELEFWSLAAEHMSREEIPSFRDMVRWVDLLFKAPVHFVYIKETEDKLRLFRRQILSENLQYLLEYGDTEGEKMKQRMLEEFEDRLQNIEAKIAFNREMESHGVSSFSIGQCQHIPLYEGDEFWGIYCVGPYVSTPETIVPRISIIGRLLSGWLRKLYESDDRHRHNFKMKFNREFGELDTGTLNVEGISKLLMGFEMENRGADAAALLSVEEEGIQLVSYQNLGDTTVSSLKNSELPDSPGEILDSIEFKTGGEEGGESFNEVESHELKLKGKKSFLFYFYIDPEQANRDGAREDMASAPLERLLTFQETNRDFSRHLLDSFYNMLRQIEQRNNRTQHHTLRIMALCEQFSKLFGMDPEERRQLMLTAKLHDIGYVGISLFSRKRSVAVEIEHPIIGQKMVSALPIDEEVKKGIATHHEWVDGSGTPYGLKEEEIPWTGKIVGTFEYIVEFIEAHEQDSSREPEEWLEQLTTDLLERADKQFDMVLIPTIIELLTALGWEGCCEARVKS